MTPTNEDLLALADRADSWNRCYPGNLNVELLVADLSAALRVLVAERQKPQAVKVKPLQWHKSHMSGWDGDWHTVPTGYTIRCADENGWKWSTPLGAFGYGHSPEAAKSAAEADHAARIRSQIDAVPAAQVRAEALEEAAALPPYDCDGDPAGSFDHHVFVKRDAIRALIEKENFYLYLCAR